MSQNLRRDGNRPYDLGEILAVSSNGHGDNFLGVVIEQKFWREHALLENSLSKDEIKNVYERESEFTLVRVLGTRYAHKASHSNDPNHFDPNTDQIIRYESGFWQGSIESSFARPINLRPLLNNDIAIDILVKRSQYTNDALNQAGLVYEYLDGRRFVDKSANHITIADKFIRYLEKAIPPHRLE